MIDIIQSIKSCSKCSLHESRTHVVPGIGNTNEPDFMFVGEAPGEQEDLTGYPFVGRSGKLLTRIINAMNYTRAEVYIANAVKCRPENNQTPTDEQIHACFPYLEQQVKYVKPKVIIILGRSAAKALLNVDDKIPMKELRGKIHSFLNIPTVVTYHPSYLLRAGDTAKAETWRDMKFALNVLHKVKHGEQNQTP